MIDDDDGAHRIVGRRATDLIKTGGYRIGAGEMEIGAAGPSRVAEAAVIGLPDADLGERMCVRWCCDPGEDRLVDRPRGTSAALSPHKRPRTVRMVDSLPRNAMGKVLKKELAAWG